MSIRQDIGPVSAYALAKEKGYQGTEEEFEQAMANVGTNIGEIKEAIDTFNDVTVPTATQSITNEGNTQVGLVNAAGTAQVEAVEEKGTIEIGAVEAAGTAQVGAVNSAGSTQVGNVNTAGSTQVNAVNGAGTTQVGNVNTAGGTQVAAVQAKGDEVIASIPEDYSDLTQEVSDLNQALSVYTGNEEIQFTNPTLKKYINTSGATTDFTESTASSSLYNYAVLDCAEGDKFTIFGTGGVAGRLWAFVKSNGVIMDPRAGEAEAGNNLVLTAPEDADKLVINFVGEGHAYKNNLIANRVSDLEINQSAEINDIKTGFIYGTENVVSGNLLPFADDFIDGKYYSQIDGHIVQTANANYKGFILPVQKNTEYVCTYFRFALLLEADKYTTIGSTIESNTRLNSGNASFIAISFNKNTYPIESYAISKGVLSSDPYKMSLPWLYNDKQTSKILPNGFYAEEENPASGSTLTVINTSNNVKYNKKLVYEAHFTEEIGNVTIYHGTGTYGSRVQITPTNIIVYTSSAEIYNEAHGISIADYLYILIDTDDQNNAKISVMSNGKRVEHTVAGWNGWQGQVYAVTASALTYHRLTWTCSDLNRPIWVFGDSYLSKTSTERYGYYLHEWGYDKFLACGYPGAGSNAVITSFSELLKITQPKYIIWALGMNDPDSESAINQTWLECAESVLTACKSLNIIPIFTKIPNAKAGDTLYNHSFKNAWIDENVERFVNVPLAVGAQANGTWYDQLAEDNGIHPSWRGAQAIAYQFVADIPELMD